MPRAGSPGFSPGMQRKDLPLPSVGTGEDTVDMATRAVIAAATAEAIAAEAATAVAVTAAAAVAAAAAGVISCQVVLPQKSSNSLIPLIRFSAARCVLIHPNRYH